MGAIPGPHYIESAGALLNRLTDFGSYCHLAFDKNYYLLLAIIFAMMIVLKLAARYEDLVAYALPKQSAKILALAGMAVATFIFLQPIRQFIYFRF
jgi:hypothetical protein